MNLLKSGALVSTSLLAGSMAVRGAEKPNVIVIMADDIGYECYGFSGNEMYSTPNPTESYENRTKFPYSTPNLDAMAAEGVKFTHAYSQPLCTPSRVKIMTGQSNVRNYSVFRFLDPDNKTIGHMMQDAGYKTCMAGKWQLDDRDVNGDGVQDGMHPSKAGFDEYYMWQIHALGSRYWNPKLNINSPSTTTFSQSKVDTDYPDEGLSSYGPDILAYHVRDFISRNKSEPFFVYYPMILVHDPFPQTPDSTVDYPTSTAAEKKIKEHAYYADMVKYMDKIIGRLKTHLENEGVADNTLIIVTGDNGTNTNIHSYLDGQYIRGGKGSTTDAGTRVGFISYWPAHNGLTSDVVCDDVIDFSDIMATIAEAGGATLPDDRVIDGQSFLAQIKGEAGTPRDNVYVAYLRGTDKRFARTQKYKLYKGSGNFYNIENDVLEKNPIVNPTAQELIIKSQLQAKIDNMPNLPERTTRFQKNSEYGLGIGNDLHMPMDSVFTEMAKMGASTTTLSETGQISNAITAEDGSTVNFTADLTVTAVSDDPSRVLYMRDNLIGMRDDLGVSPELAVLDAAKNEALTFTITNIVDDSDKFNVRLDGYRTLTVGNLLAAEEYEVEGEGPFNGQVNTQLVSENDLTSIPTKSITLKPVNGSTISFREMRALFKTEQDPEKITDTTISIGKEQAVKFTDILTLPAEKATGQISGTIGYTKFTADVVFTASGSDSINNLGVSNSVMGVNGNTLSSGSSQSIHVEVKNIVDDNSKYNIEFGSFTKTLIGNLGGSESFTLNGDAFTGVGTVASSSLSDTEPKTLTLASTNGTMSLKSVDLLFKKVAVPVQITPRPLTIQAGKGTLEFSEVFKVYNQGDSIKVDGDTTTTTTVSSGLASALTAAGIDGSVDEVTETGVIGFNAYGKNYFAVVQVKGSVDGVDGTVGLASSQLGVNNGAIDSLGESLTFSFVTVLDANGNALSQSVSDLMKYSFVEVGNYAGIAEAGEVYTDAKVADTAGGTVIDATKKLNFTAPVDTFKIRGGAAGKSFTFKTLKLQFESGYFTPQLTPAIGVDVKQTDLLLEWTVEDERNVKKYQVINAETGAVINEIIADSSRSYQVTLQAGVKAELIVVDYDGSTQAFKPVDGNMIPVQYQLTKGWNLIATVGLNSDLSEVAAVTSGPMWTWNGRSYIQADTTKAYEGLWVYSGKDVTVNAVAERTEPVLVLKPGWNLNGPANNIDAPTNATVFSWRDKYNQILEKSQALYQGIGYWFFVTKETEIEVDIK